MKKCFVTNTEIKTLLKIKSILIDQSLPSLLTLLFNRSARGLLPKFIRLTKLFNNDENNHTALIKKQSHANIYTDMQKIPIFT